MIDKYDLIWKFIQKHGYKYDYREVKNIKNEKEYVDIICDKHGKFRQKAQSHIVGKGCTECGHEKRISMIRKNKIEYYLNKFHEVHLDEMYDYRLVNEIFSIHDKIKIRCKKHNIVFEQEVNKHLQLRKGCPKCISEMRSKNAKNQVKLTTELALENMKKACNEEYEFLNFEYIDRYHPIKAICPIHGEFITSYAKITSGYGCSKCNGGVKYTDEEWVNAYNELHEGKYTNIHIEGNKIFATCPKHGEFSVKKISKAYGCPYCSKENLVNKNRLNIFSNEEKEEIINKIKHDDVFNLEDYLTQWFINKAKEKHGNNIIYDKVHYIDAQTDVCLICPIHGEFWQTPTKHLEGVGCPKCYGNVRKTTEEFLEEVKKIHRDNIIFDEVDYVNNHTLVKCKCPKHGYFYRTPKQLLHGRGCQTCNLSKLENNVMNVLTSNNIDFIKQKRFEWLLSDKQNPMSLDFYLPEYNIAIECQGEQHFIPIDHFGGEDKFKNTVNRDNLKRQLCEDNDIKLMYYSNLDIEYPYFVYTNLDEMIKIILNNN